MSGKPVYPVDRDVFYETIGPIQARLGKLEVALAAISPESEKSEANPPVLPGELVEAVRDHVSPKTSQYPDTWKRLVAALASLPDPLPTVESVRADERERLAKAVEGDATPITVPVEVEPRTWQPITIDHRALATWLRSQKGEG